MANGQAVGRVPHDPARHAKTQHHLGFDDAFEEALARLSEDVGTGTYDVTVQFEAEVKVTNPGAVNFYRVTLTTT